MAKQLPYKEGTWFALPLENGGYAIGVVARMAPRGRIILAYFFGPKRNHIPSLAELSNLQAKNAIKCKRVGDLGLMNGAWTIIGELENWDPRLWPMPSFVRKNSIITKAAWLVIYPDSNPRKPIQEERIPYDTADNYETDSLSGYGYIEDVMSDLLNDETKHD